MPIYEYRCGGCKRRVSIFIQGFKENPSVQCPKCGSTDLTRLFSTFRIGKGDWYMRKGVYEDILDDHQLTRGLMANDSKSLAEWNKRMMRATGDEVAPEFEDMQGRLESGERWDKVMNDAQSSLGLGDQGKKPSGGEEE
ncbi:MAG: zinc ribbon domain-containing protein [Chloroflexi bacterium]|nr:zinc ribbon domain-containing protein [Chloroflexota bacterium]